MTKEVKYILINAVLSLVISNSGFAILKEFPENIYLGITTILMGFILLYFSFYSFQIKVNQEKIKDIERTIENFESHKTKNEKLLNTIKDIVILNKIKKIK